MSMKTIRNSSVEGGCDCSRSNLYAKVDAHLVSRTSILTNILSIRHWHSKVGNECSDNKHVRFLENLIDQG